MKGNAVSTQVKVNRPYALPAGAGTPLAWFQSTVVRKASCSELGVTEITISPGDEPPFHGNSYELIRK